mmetsp:Transcript_14704/g.12942  ORF Transcript_14704/g.12942 Transcript_14704/m.12942 type:complete len:117 (-) Transcript_14704:12-362(-)
MATYDPEDDIYYSMCKVGTGFKDTVLKDFTERLSEVKIESQPPNVIVNTFFKPDVWFTPKEVWEISADSFSSSNNYTIGNGINTSLRFPRFIRERHDKNINQSSHAQQIQKMYKDQ